MITIRNSSIQNSLYSKVYSKTTSTKSVQDEFKSNLSDKTQLLRENLKSIADDASKIITDLKSDIQKENAEKLKNVKESMSKLFGQEVSFDTDKNSFSVGDTEFSPDELRESSSLLSTSIKKVSENISEDSKLNFADYGKFSIARNIVDKYSKKNHNEEQSKVINEALNKYIDNLESIHKTTGQVENTSFEESGSSSTVVVSDLATVTDDKIVTKSLDVIKKVTAIFEKTDFSDPVSVNTSLAQYNELVSAVYEAESESESQVKNMLKRDYSALSETIKEIVLAGEGYKSISEDI